MRAYQPVQAVGLQWPTSHPMPVYERSTRPSRTNAPKQEDWLRDLERQMEGYFAEREATVAELRKIFVFVDHAPVQKMLFEHQALPELLLQSVPSLRQCFGPETILQLRAPIDASGSQTLFAVAIWPGHAQAARDALSAFDDGWWLAQARRASGSLTFTYELV